MSEKVSELNELCQRMHWTLPRYYKKLDGGHWAVEVFTRPDQAHTFTATDTCSILDSIRGAREARKAVAVVALPALLILASQAVSEPQTGSTQSRKRRHIAVSVDDDEAAATVVLDADAVETKRHRPCDSKGNELTLTKVGTRYGWGLRFFKEDSTRCWGVEVWRGLRSDSSSTFMSTDSSEESRHGAKQGRRAASAAAMDGLADALAREAAMPTLSLKTACMRHFNGWVHVKESCEAAWATFWSDPPRYVGIDVEGNQQSPPCLIQVATGTTVILEAPSRRGHSPNMQRLLDDDSVIKVFCDSQNQTDKLCLGLRVPTDMTEGPIVDLEAIVSKRMGGNKLCIGLGRIFSESVSVPVAGVRVVKQGGEKEVARFWRIEQGRAPQLTCVGDLTQREREYSALDAWVTLVSWIRLTSDSLKLPPWSVIDFPALGESTTL
eukprot:m.154522 g.154522  ORF g.154522 m.154522 type:complete len:438 (+) comp23514_c0_seq1:246-1559(+)